MDPEEQARNYDQIADYWNGPEFNRDNGIRQHHRALQFSKKSGKAIDVGCGSSGRIVDLMLEHGFEVEGLDYSIEMLNYAKRRHPGVVFHHANICDWEFSKQYDFISAWDSIWHVPLKSQEAVLRKLFDALQEGGVIIFTSGAVDEPGEAVGSCLGQELYHAALGVPALLDIVTECGCICRHLENDDWPDRHLYIIAQKKRS